MANPNPDEPHYCRDCGHTESLHPENKPSTVRDIIQSYKQPSKMGLKLSLKATTEQAVRETNKGLKASSKRPVESDDDEGNASRAMKAPKGQKKPKNIPPDSEKALGDNMAGLGRIILLPFGVHKVQGKPELTNTRAPKENTWDDYEEWQLSRTYGLDGGPLAFNKSWTAAEIDRWLRTLFPKAFEYVDSSTKSSGSALGWHLAHSFHRNLTLYRKTVDGEVLAQHRTRDGKKWNTRVLYIALHKAIPYEIYSEWGAETTKQDAEEEEVEIEDSDKVDAEVNALVSDGRASESSDEKSQGGDHASVSDGEREHSSDESEFDIRKTRRLTAVQKGKHKASTSSPIRTPLFSKSKKGVLKGPMKPRLGKRTRPIILDSESEGSSDSATTDNSAVKALSVAKSPSPFPTGVTSPSRVTTPPRDPPLHVAGSNSNPIAGFSTVPVASSSATVGPNLDWLDEQRDMDRLLAPRLGNDSPDGGAFLQFSDDIPQDGKAWWEDELPDL
ncbi:hypothetical protein GLOTRDRAFT_123664 [Gloeophyllum trabeum ATCC 11539]|uniref:Uncharacterized protein n=1 Tax=Gloeophyllum trabeum (strain ATCC 11539 / FP-39264 / Madison 617) TaxID=670483 RepID=S7RCH7_GLOTA|nr:uncharacterized protein GLOTRDRAFT_123664 [Gloeophyllum trabeum ATCC 11539]EPQ50094.1 hypothetical protein GLOTRDRAFT_123664 [Gloeophyllum trabeum ATCC 11539]